MAVFVPYLVIASRGACWRLRILMSKYIMLNTTHDLSSISIIRSISSTLDIFAPNFPCGAHTRGRQRLISEYLVRVRGKLLRILALGLPFKLERSTFSSFDSVFKDEMSDLNTVDESNTAVTAQAPFPDEEKSVRGLDSERQSNVYMHQDERSQVFNTDNVFDPNIDFNAFEADILEEDSPYAEVRSAVANFDDPDMPVNTIRAWTLGVIWTIVLAGINQLIVYRFPSIFISSVSPLFVPPCKHPTVPRSSWRYW
ncbi:hypothetical protein D9757_007479 [Collybiopsis confluens]|uniref:Uncharacterized protein n=1 Tax=Collybiopsis confluens TaxID=2823264 RepID=A0A8H5HKB3_9AGAR|nr:hypothetical protein D9757_007479 [Collybiopsis confluens]